MNLRQLLTLKAAIPSAPRERTVVGNPVSFRTKYAEPMSLVVPFTPVQAGSGTPSPENVRAISGYSGVQIGVTGKNLFPVTLESGSGSSFQWVVNDDGTVTFSGTPSANPTITLYNVAVSANLGSIVISGFDSSVKNVVWNNLYLYDGNNTELYHAYVNKQNDITIDLSQYPTVAKMTLTVKRQANGTAVSGTMKPMIRLASAIDGTFEAYAGDVYQITFTESGTVYGGTLTVNDDQTGTLVVDTAFYEFDGSDDENWESPGTGTYKFAKIVVEAFKGRTEPAYCNEFVYGVIGNNTENIGYDFLNTNQLRVRFDLLTSLDVSAIRSYFAEHPMQIAYPVATPTTYNLTPDLVKSIVGLNNVWTDTNGQNTVTYLK